MAGVTFEPISGDAAEAVRAMLNDRALRTALFGGHGGVAADAAWAIWSAVDDGSWRRAVRSDSSGGVVGAVGVAGDALSFFVGPGLRGCGHGHAMVGAVAAQWRSLLTAQVVRENFASRRIIEAAGFRWIGTVPQPGGRPLLLRYIRDRPD